MKRQGVRDIKVQALAKLGTLNPHPEKVRDPLFTENAFFDPRDLLQVKYEMVRRVRLEGAARSQSAYAFGFSRPSLYQAERDFKSGGLSGLLPRRRGPRQGHKLNEAVLAFLVETRASNPSAGAQDLADRVEKEFGVRVHRRTVERALLRYEKKRVERRPGRRNRQSHRAGRIP